jgi:dimeric dUTPase (all-alpha-NTP-PPase superfamily)
VSDNILARIFARQEQLQAESFGIVPATMDDEAKMAYIRSMSLALTDELHEALNETGWKPWAASNHLNADAFGAELVDALHFMVNLWLAAGWTADDVAEYYFKKAERNAARQRDGYDGLAGKCRVCKHDIADPGVYCSPEECCA